MVSHWVCRKLDHPLELAAMLAVRHAWAAGRPMNVVARSGQRHFGLMADDHRSQHFGLFANGHLRAYARCAPLPRRPDTGVVGPGHADGTHVMDTLLAHPDLRLDAVALKTFIDGVKRGLKASDGRLSWIDHQQLGLGPSPVAEFTVHEHP